MKTRFCILLALVAGFIVIVLGYMSWRAYALTRPPYFFGDMGNSTDNICLQIQNESFRSCTVRAVTGKQLCLSSALGASLCSRPWSSSAWFTRAPGTCEFAIYVNGRRSGDYSLHIDGTNRYYVTCAIRGADGDAVVYAFTNRPPAEL